MLATQPKNTLYDRRTRSSRQLTPLRRFANRLAVPVAGVIVRGVLSLLRLERVIGEEHLAGALREHGQCIPVYWHQHQLLAVKYLLGWRQRGLRLGFLITPSVDGEIPAELARRTGSYVIRGSSSATGAQALRDYFDAMRKEGVSPALTPDGPHGPRREFKAGAVLMSQLAGKPILPMAYAARRAWLFRTWDRFVLPWPLSGCVLAIGEPRIVPRRLDAAALAAWQDDMKQALDALYLQARAELERR